jgi:hypothetical protein
MPTQEKTPQAFFLGTLILFVSSIVGCGSGTTTATPPPQEITPDFSLTASPTTLTLDAE